MPTVWERLGRPGPWENADKVIEAWLKERDEVVKLLFKLAGIREVESEENALDLLHQFCEYLTDYVCVLQLEILSRINEAERLAGSSQEILQQKIILDIIKSTNPILDIVDILLDPHTTPGKFTKKLNELGTLLSQRLEYEDLLINTYLRVRNTA